MRTLSGIYRYRTINSHEKVEFQFFKKFSGVSIMKPTEVKQEYQLQIWSSMIQEQKASGLSIKNWCMENGVSENSYYYRLRKIRQTACAALEQMKETTIAEIPLAPKTNFSAQVRITMKSGTVEISDAGPEILAQILKVLSHAE